jgi:hypothetical protein
MKSLRGIAYGACSALALAACANDGPDFPVTTQGGGGAGGGGTATPVIRGRVCLISDPRFLATCATTGAGGLTVTIGNGTATTIDNGTFVMNMPTSGATSTISATGTGIVPAITPFTTTATIPVINQALFDQMVLATGITTSAGTGSILATVVRNGEPVPNVNATATPAPAFGPFFDGTTPTGFTLNPTGAQGVVFFSGAATNAPVNVTFTDSATQAETTVGGVQVIDGGITFVEGILP